MEPKRDQQLWFFCKTDFQQTTIIDGLFAKKTKFAIPKTDPKTMKNLWKNDLEKVMKQTWQIFKKLTQKGAKIHEKSGKIDPEINAKNDAKREGQKRDRRHGAVAY